MGENAATLQRQQEYQCSPVCKSSICKTQMKPLKTVCTLSIQFWGSVNLSSVTFTQWVNHLAMVACQSFQVSVHYP
jgi:hypothetical protein